MKASGRGIEQHESRVHFVVFVSRRRLDDGGAAESRSQVLDVVSMLVKNRLEAKGSPFIRSYKILCHVGSESDIM